MFVSHERHSFHVNKATAHYWLKFYTQENLLCFCFEILHFSHLRGSYQALNLGRVKWKKGLKVEKLSYPGHLVLLYRSRAFTTGGLLLLQAHHSALPEHCYLVSSELMCPWRCKVSIRIHEVYLPLNNFTFILDYLYNFVVSVAPYNSTFSCLPYKQWLMVATSNKVSMDIIWWELSSLAHDPLKPHVVASKFNST